MIIPSIYNNNAAINKTFLYQDLFYLSIYLFLRSHKIKLFHSVFKLINTLCKLNMLLCKHKNNRTAQNKLNASWMTH
jgi:hypothetical protein